MRDDVEGWLSEAGLSYEEVELEEGAPYKWGLIVDQNFKALVAERDTRFPHLFIQVAVNVSPPHREALEGVDEDTRDRFLFDLRIALAKLPVGASLRVSDGDPIPTDVVFGYNLMEEPIQRSGFFRRNHQLQQAARLTATMFQKFVRFREWS